jgi:hypothetical protein
VLREHAALQAQLSSIEGHAVESQPIATDSRQQREQIRSVNRAVSILNVPIGALLQSVQPANSMHTGLLELNLSDVQSDTGNAAVRITAESHSGQDMTDYVAQLSRDERFQSVYLTRHEVSPAKSDRPYRFVVQVSWPQ